MAGACCPPDEPADPAATRPPDSSALDASASLHYSDDERSVAADSWSVRSEYGSTLDGEDQRNANVVDALNASSFRTTDYLSDKEEQDADVEPSVMGPQSHWDSIFTDELVNFHEQGDAGDIWFGEEVTETMAAWTGRVCVAVASGLSFEDVDGFATGTSGAADVSDGGSMISELANWNVIDLGTWNGLLLYALAKQGLTDLTGTDYSEGAIQLARQYHGAVDDVLNTKINEQFKLVTDKGTLDAIGLHPDGPSRRAQYWKSLCKLLAPDGILVITSCNSTKDDLIAEVSRFSHLQESNSFNTNDKKDSNVLYVGSTEPVFEYIDCVRSYPTLRFGGVDGSRVTTIALIFRV